MLFPFLLCLFIVVAVIVFFCSSNLRTYPKFILMIRDYTNDSIVLSFRSFSLIDCKMFGFILYYCHYRCIYICNTFGLEWHGMEMACIYLSIHTYSVCGTNSSSESCHRMI